MGGTELICRKVDVINPENEHVPKMETIHSKSNEIISNDVESSIKIGLIITLGVILITGVYALLIELKKGKGFRIWVISKILVMLFIFSVFLVLIIT